MIDEAKFLQFYKPESYNDNQEQFLTLTVNVPEESILNVNKPTQTFCGLNFEESCTIFIWPKYLYLIWNGKINYIKTMSVSANAKKKTLITMGMKKSLQELIFNYV